MQCIGRTKLFNRCKNQCRCLFCRQHLYQRIIVVSFLLITLIPTTFTYFNLYDKIWGDKPITQEDLKNFKRDLDDRFNEFTIPNYDSEESYPGVTVGLLVELIPQPQYRRKYIFDLAETLNKNRVSLFLDANNVLVFELIDNSGEIYNVKIPQKLYPFNKWIILYCEYGKTDEFSFLRIFVENKLIDQHKFKFKINLPINFQERMTIMADVLGKNNAVMKVAYNSVGHVTLGKTKRRGFFNTIKSYMKAINHPYGQEEYFN